MIRAGALAPGRRGWGVYSGLWGSKQQYPQYLQTSHWDNRATPSTGGHGRGVRECQLKQDVGLDIP